jgi:beta-aspartyl-peptidase (threonine type)
LEKGASAIEACEIAVRVLEDDPTFDAGTGSVLNEEGVVEMDSCIMRGSDLNIGAIAGVSCVKNAVTLAKAVMEDTAHCMIAGDGPTRKFAKSIGMELVD